MSKKMSQMTPAELKAFNATIFNFTLGQSPSGESVLRPKETDKTDKAGGITAQDLT